MIDNTADNTGGTMSQDSVHKRHRPIVVNLAWVLALLAVLLVGYVFSYAPALRLMLEMEGLGSADLTTRLGRLENMPVYKPVDHLIDSTSLQEPLFLWAGVFGVRDEFEFALELRIQLRILQAFHHGKEITEDEAVHPSFWGGARR